MKKLKLKMRLSGAELLDREKMKQIMGGLSWADGSGSGSGPGGPGGPPDCAADSCDAHTDNCGDPCTCQSFVISPDEGPVYICG